ncbi:peptidase S8, putative [Babesia ovata]|uniref:Peptidase S8, putative n=1 Tax=Babesia ovata TaxID=189622 RepID=A0A2H6KGZ3_9APIC|nr:peptidase S8, putative [Babesia ovata]GBE62239.1 peptidase S8, putative [Babesia ovata]
MEVEQMAADGTLSGAPGEAPDSQSRSNDPLFESKYFTREEFAPFTLPYGTLCCSSEGNTGDVDKPAEIDNTDPKAWAAGVFENCISFIRGSQDPTKTCEWYHDFIALTNLQAALYADHELLQGGENLDLILEYTNKHVRNLRSSVAKNALFLVGCIIEATEHDTTLFVAVSLRLLPHLFKCSTSEKIVYRKPAIQNIVAICQRCRSSESVAIAWMLIDHALDRSPKICAAATIGMETFFGHFEEELVTTLDLEEVAERFEPCLAGRNVTLRKLCSDIVIKIADRLSLDTIQSWLSYAASKRNLKKLLKPYVPTPEPSEPLSDETNDEIVASSSGETSTNGIVKDEVEQTSPISEEQRPDATTDVAAIDTTEELTGAVTTQAEATEKNEE